MKNEPMGAFIDAVYAIAVTIIALEIPAEVEGSFSLELVGSMVATYSITFVIIFGLWLQHRSINGHIPEHGTFGK